jgi:acyl-coenzyme A synthetase/AMP-(fatty) acid ligase
MSSGNGTSVWSLLSGAAQFHDCRLIAAETSIALGDLGWGSSLGGWFQELRGASVLVATLDQLTAALTIIELDGIARRLILCPSDLSPEQLAHVAATGAVDAVVSDGAESEVKVHSCARWVRCSPKLTRAEADRDATWETEWILLTSGTTGMPKLVAHSLSSLIGAIKRSRPQTDTVVWSTFYDIRRYGGLQIFLRALLDGRSLVLSAAKEPVEDFLTRAGASGVTHISGTPSHWRRALMSPSARKIAPRYIRLSGEIIDQPILDRLRTVYGEAEIVHAFASTEAGVGFEVRDGLAGFPASLLGMHDSGVEMKVENGSLRIRSPRTAMHYLGNSNEALRGPGGFVDTHDLVEMRGERYHFVGRRDGVINVGGLKVHPEEVEAVINRHPRVRMSLVKARGNPVTGALVVADVVEQSGVTTAVDLAELRNQILEICRQVLAPYKVPALIRFVPSLQLRASGKLVRS